MRLNINHSGLLIANIFGLFFSHLWTGQEVGNATLTNGSNKTVIKPFNTSLTVSVKPMKTLIELDKEEAEERHRVKAFPIRVIESILFTTIAAIGMFGNSVVIIAILQEPELQIQKQLSNMTVLSLAAADWLALAIVCLPCAVTVFYNYYPFWDGVCLICSLGNLGFIIATIGCLTVISFERWIVCRASRITAREPSWLSSSNLIQILAISNAVTYPLHYPQYVTYNRLLFFQGIIWFHALWTPLVWAIYGYGYDWDAGVCDLDWGSYEPGEWFPLAFGVWNITYQSGFPGAIMAYCNTSIIRTSRKNKGRAGKVESKANEEEARANAKILKGMLICILSFWLMTMPLGFVRLRRIFGQPVPFWITRIASYIQFLASCANPLIYGLFRKDFRDAYNKMWKNFKMHFNH